MKENRDASSICKIMVKNANSVRKVIQDISKIVKTTDVVINKYHLAKLLHSY